MKKNSSRGCNRKKERREEREMGVLCMRLVQVC